MLQDIQTCTALLNLSQLADVAVAKSRCFVLLVRSLRPMHLRQVHDRSSSDCTVGTISKLGTEVPGHSAKNGVYIYYLRCCFPVVYPFLAPIHVLDACVVEWMNSSNADVMPLVPPIFHPALHISWLSRSSCHFGIPSKVIGNRETLTECHRTGSFNVVLMGVLRQNDADSLLGHGAE